MFCPVCRSAFEDFWLLEDCTSRPHHQDYESLRRSVYLGCKACNDLLGLLPHDLSTDAAAPIEGPCTLYIRGTCMDDTVRVYLQYSWKWRQSTAPLLGSNGLVHVAVPVSYNPSETIAELHSESSDHVYSQGPFKPQSGHSTASPYSWMLMTRWVSQCRHSHTVCNSYPDRS